LLVTVTFKNDATVEHMVPAARGISQPCTKEDIVEKWRKLTRVVLDEERWDKI
jgi:hypothetical protein